MAIKQCRYMSEIQSFPLRSERARSRASASRLINKGRCAARLSVSFCVGHLIVFALSGQRTRLSSSLTPSCISPPLTDPGAFMQPEPLPTFIPQLSQRFQSLVWSCIDSDLVKTAVFHAERYYSLDKTNHDARHLYATALLRAQQTYSALHLVSGPRDEQCTGCLEIKAKCCTALGRYRQAREALDTTLFDPTYVTSSTFLCCLAPLRLTYSSPSLHRIIDQSGGERLSRGCSNSM